MFPLLSFSLDYVCVHFLCMIDFILSLFLFPPPPKSLVCNFQASSFMFVRLCTSCSVFLVFFCMFVCLFVCFLCGNTEEHRTSFETSSHNMVSGTVAQSDVL